MKPSVKLLDGLHITPSDKRNILASIEFLRDKDPATWGTTYVGLKRSPKSYGILPDPDMPGRYAVAIRTKYLSDAGAPREELLTVVVEIIGAAPLPHPAYQTRDLFAPKPWEAQP